MEKIVTKIGDVTIERRVSKPQPKDVSIEPLQQLNLKNVQRPEEQVISLPNPSFSKDLTIGNVNISRIKNVSGIQGGNFDLKPKSTEIQNEFPEPEDKLQDVEQRDFEMQSDLEEDEVGLPEPKETQFVPKGPDLSKLVGISIERRKKVDSEPQAIEGMTDERFLSPQELDLKPEMMSDDEFEDSFDEDYMEDEFPPAEEVEEFKHSPEPAVISDGDHEKSDPEVVALSEDEPIKKEEGEGEEEEEEEMEIKQEKEEAKESDINDLVCNDLVEMMQKGELEGEIEEVKEEVEDEESDEKKDNKRKAEDGEDEGEKKDEEAEPSKKKKKSKDGEKEEEDEDDEEDEDEEGGDKEGKEKNIDKSKVTNANLRKNIREVMDETKLDEATLAAQRQEAERLKRLQEQQRIIREVQRQIALNRQNQKSQNKVLSLLQGNSQTSILKTSSTSTQAQNAQAKSQSSVLVKLSNGEQTSLNNKKMMELLKNSKNKTVLGKPAIPKTLLKQGLVTPSVTIAPIAKKEPVVDKKKKGDVVTLSSDSEDDCIVLSDEDESEPEEDPANSGMHTNDKYNLPDEKGRVIVNVGHPESESDLYLAPQIARIIKPHQIGGIRFLYDNVIESIERFKNSAGFGCILAHSMGLGKTLQIVSFSDIFLRYTSAKTILCIMPINTIQNWLAEFNMWLPKESSSEEIRCREFDLFIVNESLKNIKSRARVILEWHKSGGVLLMGYELFRLLSLKKSYKSKKKKKNPEEEDAKYKELMDEVYAALVLPGPDLVICDEGHRIKNSHATTSQALKQIRTKRRIVLTGYPLQNNLLEYWCMVDFVRPNYLGTKTEFSNMFERPIQNGQCIDSTPQDKRLMRYRAHVLHSLLEGFVQRRSHAVLQSTLPEKEEYVLLLRFTPFQRKLYDTFMNEVVRAVAVPNPLKAFAVCCKIWNHPDVLYNFLKKKGEEIDLDLEEALPPSMRIPQFPYGQPSVGPDGTTQQLPGAAPWPRRGPGSRGGKVRIPGARRAGRGRKPAATIPPNVDKSDSFNSAGFPPNENFPNQQETMDNYQGRGYNQNQFGFNNNYNNQPPPYPGSNYNKNPLNNLEDMSSTNYQNKRFFPHQNGSGSQNQFGNQNFDPTDTTFSSNDSNLNSSFDSNLNSSDSNYNQNEFGQDYNSEFYSGGNFQNNSGSYSGQNKNTTFQNNSYYQNSGNFNYQSSGNSYQGYNNAGSNFQGPTNRGPNFQNSASGGSFQETNPGSNFQGSFQNNTNSGGFMNQNSGSNFQGSNSNFDQSNNYQQGYWPQSNWGYPEASKSSGTETQTNTGNDFMNQKFNSFGEGQEVKTESKDMTGGNNSGAMYNKTDCDYSSFGKSESDSKFSEFEDSKANKPKEDEGEEKKEDVKSTEVMSKKDDTSLPYDWATDLFKTYVTGVIENSSKMEVFFHIVTESVKLGDRLLVFSQSLLTLDLIEDYLHRQNVPDKEEVWARNRNYFRLDGSTPGLEREKLINEFNANPNIYLFLVSTRAGSLGINLVGANRVVVFDASWNPCHDTQAVCRVYRYGQRKPCFVYRLVMDSCLEKKIYDRQVNKQGMADRVVDELNPDAHLSIKEVTNLCWDDQEDTTVKDFSNLKDKYNDEIIKILLERCSKLLSKEPFQHESLLIDRKEKKLSQAEKRLAKRSYELEKQAANQPKNIYSFFPNSGQRNFAKPIASVRPMQSEMGSRLNPQMQSRAKWIPAEVWQKQGMSAQEMTLPLDVVIPTSSPEKTSIVLKAGQRVMVLKSPKGIYMQLENGKIIAIRSAFKVGQNGPGGKSEDNKKDGSAPMAAGMKTPNMPMPSKMASSVRPGLMKQPFLKPFAKTQDKKMPGNMPVGRPRQVMGRAKPFMLNRKFENVTPDIKQRLMSGKMGFGNQEDKQNLGGQSGSEARVPADSQTDEEKLIDSSDEKTENKPEGKSEMSDSLETLRKVTESISDPTQREGEGDGKYPQMNSLKNYRHNFASQGKGPQQGEDEEKKKDGDGTDKGDGSGSSQQQQQQQQQGNENVQNWLMNQSYPPMDPYGNYFPGYYYGPGPGPMMPPYDGFYPPNNYGHPMGRNSPMVPPPGQQPQQQNAKEASQQVQPQTSQNPAAGNPATPRNQPNPPSMYPPYPNPYPYPYNYPGNPGFNNQGYPFPNQNQPGQQQQQPPPHQQPPPIPQQQQPPPQQSQQQQQQPPPQQPPQQQQQPVPPNPPPTGNNNHTPGQNPQAPYDNSMYSAFHRPDAPFQTPENPYPAPYPRPPYPNSGTPGFFPYNAPYPNYPYGPNFNPYMHPGGYGYPMQNPPVNNQAQNPSGETANSSNSNVSTN